MNAAGSVHIRAEQLLNRPVRARNGRVIGRIEEIRVEAHGTRYTVTAYVLGAGGLLERLAIVGRRVLGHRIHTVVARWDQVDVSQPDWPRLTCDRAELHTE